MFKGIKEQLIEQIVDDDKRIAIQFNFAYFLFFVISFGMSVVNFFTGNILVMLATMFFAFLCIFDFGLSRINSTCSYIAKTIFALQILSLFTFFIVTGMLEGFSTIWICMLPSFALLMFKRRYATLISATMLVILIALLWTPLGNIWLMYEYSAPFRLRFPLVFFTFYILAFFLETIRRLTADELKKVRVKYDELYVHDELTGLLNRRGFNRLITSDRNSSSKRKESVFMVVAIDHFGAINDTHRHETGNVVLKEVATILKDNFECPIFRRGGGEFVAYSSKGRLTEKRAKEICDLCAKHVFDEKRKKLHITVSIGMAFGPHSMNLDELFNQADACLYKAKNDGRNTVRVIHL